MFGFFNRVRSAIRLAERLPNRQPKFGAQPTYFPVTVVAQNGKKIRALFTENQIDVAIERAYRNPEDWV